MASPIVPILPSSVYIRFNNWVQPGKSGHISPVFTANFNIDGQRKLFHCKPYRTQGGKGLFNEIAGYIITRCRGVPQPAHAFMTYIARENIPEIRRYCPVKLYDWIYQKPNIPLFCTETAKAMNMPLDTHSTEREESIARWPHLGAAVALDDNIANTDRHPYNLLRTGTDNYLLIDNGILITETDLHGNWTAADIDNGKAYRNQLADLAGQYHQKSAVIHATTQQPSIAPAAWDELESWASLLLTEEESRLFLDFIKTREQNASCLLKTRYHMI